MKSKYTIDRDVMLDELLPILLREYGLVHNKEEIVSRSRRCDLVFARAVLAMWMRRMGLSVVQIGYVLDRDHSGITHMLHWDDEYRYDVLRVQNWGSRNHYAKAIYKKAQLLELPEMQHVIERQKAKMMPVLECGKNYREF